MVGIALLFVLSELSKYYDVLILPSTFTPALLVYGGVAQIVLLLIISYAWKCNMHICTGKAISLKACFCQVSLVLVGKYIPGKIWGMYARSLHLLSHNISYRESLLGTYLEQLISVHSGLAFGITAWLIAVKSWLILPSLIFIIVSILFSPLIQNKIFRLLSRYRKNNDDEMDVTGFEIDRRSYSILFMLYLMEWVFVGLVLVVLYFALFTMPASADLILLLMGSSAVAFVAGFFAFFAPGGIGVREGVIIGLLSQHLLLADSVVLVLMFRLWFTCSDVIAGLLGLMLSDKSTDRNTVDIE